MRADETVNRHEKQGDQEGDIGDQEGAYKIIAKCLHKTDPRNDKTPLLPR